MAEPLSMDLRTRVLAAIGLGSSGRGAGLRFGVSPASVSRWRARAREQGDLAPKPMGGDRRSAGTEAQSATILARVEATPDLTLEELRAALAAEGVAVSYGALWRFLRRHKITRKKSPPTLRSKSARTS